MASAEQAGLTGVWDGLYSYSRRFTPVPFTAVILETGAALNGTIHETPPDGPSAGKTLNALLEGERSGSHVRFTKAYDDPDPGHDRSILYEGFVIGDGNEIEGTWTIRQNWSGKFLMIRSSGPAVAAEVRKAEEVPVR